MAGRIGVVIVNWNAGAQLGECVRSVESTKDAPELLEGVVVVDNASCDGSVEGLACDRVRLKIIRNEVNRGFAAASNQGAGVLHGEYILFLNPDTRLTPESVRRAVGEMSKPGAERVGIVGVQLLDERGRVSRTCCRFPSPVGLFWELTGMDRVLHRWAAGWSMNEFDHLSSREVDHVMGAFYLVRREVFDGLGGFDERFFLYFEDLDFSWRARGAGWRSWFATEAFAYHKGGGCSERIPARRLFYCWSSRILFTRKHFNRATTALVVLATLLIEPLLRLVKASFSLSFSSVCATISGYRLLLGSLGMLASGRNSTHRPAATVGGFMSDRPVA